MTTLNPYRTFLRNVHIRRIYMIGFVLPVCVFFGIPAYAIVGILDGIKELKPSVLDAITDPRTYD